MKTNSFGPLVDQVARSKGISSSKLSVLIGLSPEGRYYDKTQVIRLRRGQVRHIPSWLLARLIEVLELDPVEAWRAAYPDVVEAVLSAVGGPRPARAAGAGAAASDLGKAPSR